MTTADVDILTPRVDQRGVFYVAWNTISSTSRSIIELRIRSTHKPLPSNLLSAATIGELVESVALEAHPFSSNILYLVHEHTLQVDECQALISALALLDSRWTLAIISERHLEASTKQTEHFLSVVSSDIDNPIEVQNAVSIIKGRVAPNRNAGLSIVLRSLPSFFVPEVQTWWVPCHRQLLVEQIFSRLSCGTIKKILFFGSVGLSSLGPEFWVSALSGVLPEVIQLDTEGKQVPYRPHLPTSPDILFVFPERLLPANRAFFVRGLALINALSNQGLTVDVLLFGPNNSDLLKIRESLYAVASNVFVAPLRRSSKTRLTGIRNRLEYAFRFSNGETAPPPMRFRDRVRLFCGDSQRLAVEEVLRSRKYRSAIVTGAWFLETLRELPLEDRPRTVYCDTHDVFFVLDEHLAEFSKRYFHSRSTEQRAEISSLNQIDRVIAISDSDADNLRQGGVTQPIVTTPGSFGYSKVSVRNRRANISFGYIGTSNGPNQLALDVLLNSWWPTLRSKNPSYCLKIAGAACKTAQAKLLAEEYDAQLLGYVDSLIDFYASVDVILAPIQVQGGLNFKSVEAIVAGRHLITTPLGSRCIANIPGVWVVKTDILNVVSEIERMSPLEDTQHRERSQSLALDNYGFVGGYATLIEDIMA